MHNLMVAAPHRLLFFVGMVQLVLSILWWTLVLAGVDHFQSSIPSSLLHGPMMIYLVLPPLFFGFLLTVFPRWLGYADHHAKAFLPIGTAYALAALSLWSGQVFGNFFLIQLAFLLALVGLVWAFCILSRDAIREQRDGKGPTYHGWSILAALSFAIAGQVSALIFIQTLDATWQIAANRLGLSGFILPVFWTVCHRMIPFFSSNAVQGYERWRPFWLLGALWAGTILQISGRLFVILWPEIVGTIILLLTTALMAWKWWPRAKAPALLWVLVIGFAWAPVGYALSLASQLGSGLGRAPDHALTIGFACSLLIAMVTRVTQGHSGRPLELPKIALFAFIVVQISALTRIWAGIQWEANSILVLSAALLFAGLIRWAGRNAIIYLTPRLDGKPG